MPRKFAFKYNAGFPGLIQTRRVQAVARERAFFRRNRNVPYLFGHSDDLAIALRRRASARMHTIAREQRVMRGLNFGTFTPKWKYARSKTRYPKKLYRRRF